MHTDCEEHLHTSVNLFQLLAVIRSAILVDGVVVSRGCLDTE